MANLFIGFPVSKAKIADMITGSAPPIEHAPWHEPTGQDPIVLPADITDGQAVGWDATLEKFKGYTPAAGGITNLYDATGLFISEWFTSITAWGSSIDTGAWATLDKFGLYIGVNGTSGISAWIWKLIYVRQTAFNWNKKIYFALDVQIYTAAANSGIQWIVSGEPGTARHAGFKINNGVLYGSLGNGSTEALTAAIETLGTGSYNVFRRLECKFKVTSCEFWVNDVLAATLSTGLPTGTSDAATLIQLVVDDNAKAVSHWLKTSYIKLWKEI